ncbi:hypothetical protein L3Q82_016738 [Scortum barcoo]|uniref:Uncharacterized protein n=1 Tax=Scortum barcoo TaxID=214431 RepID=A0ACB8X817_9TELE|nr:hypothetical protein L3Q82_016738 [Scortum barcoo]
MFGEAADKYSMVLFTGGDTLGRKTIEEFVKGSADLQELVRRCNGKYHVLNNKLQDRSQVSELIKKIKDIWSRRTEEATTPTRCSKRPERQQKQYSKEILQEYYRQELELGRSATGNTILGRECFQSELSATSLTEDCSKGKAVVDGQKVSVIDTPGLFDTRFGAQKTVKDICQCFSFAAPGPHVFLVVIRLGRFTEEEKQTVQRIQEMFGKAADKYSMVLFTGGDDLDKTIEEFLKGSTDLQELVSRCNGQYHVLNNNLQDRSQVSELIKKIKDMVQKNGGSHYTNEMFQEAERAVEEEKKRILKETEEKIRKEIEKLEREAAGKI